MEELPNLSFCAFMFIPNWTVNIYILDGLSAFVSEKVCLYKLPVVKSGYLPAFKSLLSLSFTQYILTPSGMYWFAETQLIPLKWLSTAMAIFTWFVLLPTPVLELSQSLNPNTNSFRNGILYKYMGKIIYFN